MAVAPQEQYSEFPNKKCDDIDLLTVAHKIADHCEYIKINEIGRGLGLNESTAQRVAEQHQHSSHGDAIHELLLQWKEKAVTPADEVIMTTDEAITADAEAAATADEAAMADTEATTTAEDTWANLMLLLHSIFNSEPLMKALSDYLRQKVDPNPENVGKVPHYLCSIDKRPQQASDDDHTAIRKLVTGKDVTSPSPDSSDHILQDPFTEDGVNIDVKRRMKEEKKKFALLQVTACQKLQDLGQKPKIIAVYLTGLSVQQGEITPLLFVEHMAGIICKQSLSQMFIFLSRVGAWGFLNFDLLSCIANQFGDDDLKYKVEEYSRGIASFMVETKFKDYLHVYTKRIPHGSLPGCKPLIVRLKEKWGDFTLDKVVKLQGDLEGEFRLEPYIFKLCESGSYSVHVKMETAAPQRGINDTDVDLSWTEEKCSGFANKKCDDVDLLTVAHKIADCCEYIPINEICRGLGLEEFIAQRVAEQHEHSPYSDVIHELLLQWKEKAATPADEVVTITDEAITADAEAAATAGEAAATAGEAAMADAEATTTAADTWANLMPLLHSIFSSEPLMKALSDYLRQKVDPNPENVGKVPHYLYSIDKRPQQASDDDHTAIRKLVTGKDVTSPSPDSSDHILQDPFTEDGVNIDVKRRMKEEKKKFALLQATACQKLQDLGRKPEIIAVYLTGLSVQQGEATPLFDEHMAGILFKQSLSQMFMFLSRVGAWGFLNFDLLSCIANQFGDDDLNSKVEEYGRGIASFMEETKFEDYLRVYTNRIALGSLPGRKPLIAKLEGKWGEFTLDKVTKLQGDLEGEFRLEPYILKLCNGGQKCVMVMWLIPSSAVSIIKKAITEKRVDLTGSNICELIVGEDRFVFKPEVHTPTCVPTPPTSPAPQVEYGEVFQKECLLSSFESYKPSAKRTGPGNPVTQFVKERMVKLDRKFAKLLGFAHEKLTALVSVDTLRACITQLSVSQKENIPLFSKHMAEIISETSHSKIFTLLSRMGAWSMLNFRLLHGIAEEYGDEELKAAVSNYSTDVDVFKRETALEDYLYAMSSQSAYWSPPEWLIVKLKDEWKDSTLADVAQEGYLANEFQLEPHIMKDQLMNADYTTAYEESIENPEKFWGELAGKCLNWDKPFEKVMDCDMKEGKIQWFVGGKLNVSVNCLDRHVKTHPERTALIWEKDEPKQDEKVTYRELLNMTCRIANLLKKNKIEKGDTVVIYMPAAPLTVASMLACSRIGAIHSVVFTAFHQAVLREMINNANAKAVITANQRSLGGVVLPLKATVDQAVVGTHVEVVFVSSGESPLVIQHARGVHLEKAMEKESTECPPELMDSEDTLFIMYTSGTSDEPRGIVHTQAGYLLYAAVTHKCVFHYKPEEVFACVADLGWITGHSYVVYGPLCNGGTTVLFDSTASYPDYDRYWEMISRLKVNHFYTTPAAIRLLMKAGNHFVKKHDLSSLKTIGSVGEPLSDGAWTWYNNIVGKKNCTLVDTWWQTETGGIAITPYPAPSGSRHKPGFPMKPFFGVEPVIVDDKGKILEGPDVTGFLCLKKPLPGMGRCINGDPQKYKEDYFQHFPGLYFTTEIAHRDADSDYKIMGRPKNDMIPIKGVWISIPEIENAMNMSDPRVLESLLVHYKEKDPEKIERAEFNILPGTDTAGETQLIITNKKSYFEWKGYGLKLHIPENVLPQRVEQCTLNIRALLSGQFELPPEYILASAVYQIKASVKLARPVILEIQHCCSFKNSDSTSLCFVVAHTESELPYKFQKLEDGKFSSNYSYGSISLDHFSCFGIGGWLSTLFSRLYCAQLYRICQHNTTDWRLHFGITKNLDSAITGMKKKLEEDYHPDAKVLVDFKFSVQFQDDEITLSIPKEGVEIEGWKISSRYYPSITRAEVDSGRALGCLLDIHWTKQQQPIYLEYEVILEGAKSSRGYKYFTIRYAPLQAAAKPTPPPSEGHSASSSTSEMAPLHSGKETTQYKKVAAKHEQIITTLSATVSAEGLVGKLERKKLIGEEIRRKARGEREDINKIRIIMEAVLAKIELNPANYDKFIETLREFGDQADLIDCIESAT